MKAALGVLLGLLLVPLGGCLSDDRSAKQECTDWTRGGPEEADVEVDFRVRNERSEPVCLRLRLGSEPVAKVPLPRVGEDGLIPESERTVPWAEPRLTVRVDEWKGDGWATEAVDLRQTPHLVVTAVDDDLRLEAYEQAPHPVPE